MLERTGARSARAGRSTPYPRRRIAYPLVAMGFLAALLAAPVTADASDATIGSNSGQPASRSERVDPRPSFRPDEAFHVYRKPVEEYTDRKSCALDLSGREDGAGVMFLYGEEGCPKQLSFSTSLVKHTVPDGGWISWGEPPYTEDATPEVLSTDADSVVMTYYRNQRAGGVEIEPDPFKRHTFTVEFYDDGQGRGQLLGSITRTVNGRDGARLFAAKTETYMRSIVIRSDDGVGFAIAQVRG